MEDSAGDVAKTIRLSSHNQATLNDVVKMIDEGVEIDGDVVGGELKKMKEYSEQLEAEGVMWKVNTGCILYTVFRKILIALTQYTKISILSISLYSGRLARAIASVRYDYIDDFRVHMSSFSLQQEIDIVELWRVRIQFVNQFTMKY